MVWCHAYGPENVLVLEMEETDQDKMQKIMTFMGDYLPHDEYPWEQLNHTMSTKIYANTAYHGRHSGWTHHRRLMEWLYRYFHDHNVALAEELDAKWPLHWNHIPKT
jgi:hypothetical protein